MARSITAANSSLMLGFTGYYSTPFKVQGFSVDRMFDSDDVETAITQMGADGQMSAGWVPSITTINIMLQASSDCLKYFQAVDAAEQLQEEKYPAFGTLVVPAMKFKFSLINGVMRRLSRFPKAGRVLEPRSFMLDFESVLPAIIP